MVKRKLLPVKNLIFLITVLPSILFFSYSCKNNPNSTTEQAGSGTQAIVISSEDLNIHFLELGNKYTGDCIYINYGEIDILIDAGSRQTSAAAIKAYIDNFIQDDKLEYVIATHAHEDHIAGFYSTAVVTGILDSYEIGIIIDFPNTNSTTVTYSRYIEARTGAVEKGAVHYTALQCFNEEDGAQRIYDLDDNLKLEILYNYYYDHNTSNENNYSVCVRLIHGTDRYLFTGDLEKDGEGRLTDYYEEHFGGLGRTVLYKGGHHASNTSSSEKLMAAITPEYIVVCTCAGSSEYRASPENVFPSQDFIDRVAPYTDRVYITTLVTDYANNEYEPMNGSIIFSVPAGGGITITGSNNSLKLKETEWFRANRKMPVIWIE